MIESAIASLLEASKTANLNSEQQVFVNLALAKAHLCKGAGERRRDGFEAAHSDYSMARSILDDTQPLVFAETEKKGLLSRFGFGKSEPDEEAANDWIRTKGRVDDELGSA